MENFSRNPRNNWPGAMVSLDARFGQQLWLGHNERQHVRIGGSDLKSGFAASELSA